jgi:hypothetical protein
MMFDREPSGGNEVGFGLNGRREGDGKITPEPGKSREIASWQFPDIVFIKQLLNAVLADSR